MNPFGSVTIRSFLQALADSLPRPASLYLLGGSALCLLGSPRPTLDIDYWGDDLLADDWQKLIQQVAGQTGLEVEPVPIQRFLPLNKNAVQRSIYYEAFGALTVYIFDPYTIALSKLDRGFDTDLDDVVFLIHHDLVTLPELEVMAAELVPDAREFDLNPQEMRLHLQEVMIRLKQR